MPRRSITIYLSCLPICVQGTRSLQKKKKEGKRKNQDNCKLYRFPAHNQYILLNIRTNFKIIKHWVGIEKKKQTFSSKLIQLQKPPQKIKQSWRNFFLVRLVFYSIYFSSGFRNFVEQTTELFGSLLSRSFLPKEISFTRFLCKRSKKIDCVHWNWIPFHDFNTINFLNGLMYLHYCVWRKTTQNTSCRHGWHLSRISISFSLRFLVMERPSPSRNPKYTSAKYQMPNTKIQNTLPPNTKCHVTPHSLHYAFY